MKAHANGIDQRVVDLGLRSNLPVLADTWSVAGRTLRPLSDVSGRALVICFLGQSTNQNSVQAATHAGDNPHIFNVSMAHPSPTHLWQAKEPLLCADATSGHHGMLLAQGLLDGGFADNIVLVNVAVGGSYAADWCPGGGIVGGNQSGVRAGSVAYRIGLAARLLAFAGLADLPTVLDWQQGEWDSDNVATTQADHTAALAGTIVECKRVGLLRSGRAMFVHQCTRLASSSGNRNPIRAAQAAVVDGDLVLAGVDIDTLGSGTRHDGSHFTVAGAGLQADLKLPLYEAYCANVFA
jgi:hypothetical protein